MDGMHEMTEPDETTTEADGASYKICVVPHPDGTFQVYKESMQGEVAEAPSAPADRSRAGVPSDTASASPHESLATLEAALKEVIRLIKINPFGTNEQQHMEAGYAGEQGEGPR